MNAATAKSETPESISFRNSEGHKLSGILSGPRDTPLVILAHGLASSKEGYCSKVLEQRLNTLKDPIATLRFDFNAHGDSEGEFKDLTLTRCIDDVFAAIHYAREQGYEHIGLMGSSLGARACLHAAPLTDTYLLALKSPPCSYYYRDLGLPDALIAHWEKRGVLDYPVGDHTVPLPFGFYQDAIEHNGYDAAACVQVPTCIVHGDEDKLVPHKQSVELLHCLHNGLLYTIEGADHSYTKQEHFTEMICSLVDFIAQHSQAYAHK